MKSTKYIFIFFFTLFQTISVFAKNEALLSEIIEKAKTSGSDSLVIIENGKTLYSDFFGSTDRLRSIQSVTKSLSGLAIGILLDEGKIASLDTPMSQWYPDWNLNSEKSKITLKMIMSHTSGISDSSIPDFFSKPDLVSAAEAVNPVVTPGSRFEYSNVATCLLQKVIQQSAGQSVEEFVKTRILNPLGVYEYNWKKDKAGHEVISGGLKLSTASLIQNAKLILGNGTIEGKQILAESTLKTLLTKSQTYKSYGLLWWLSRPFGSTDPMNYQLFRAEGYGGQYITVYPSKGLIAVRTKDPATLSDDEATNTTQQFFEFRDLISKWE